MQRDSIIFCEGESEKGFLDSAIDLGYLKGIQKKNIKILGNYKRLLRLKSIYPGYTCYYFVHDTDDISKINEILVDASKVLGNSFVLIKTKDNMEFLISEMCGRKNKSFSKTEHTNVKTFLKKLFGKDKKITWQEIDAKKECSIKNIRNKGKYEILSFLTLP